MRTGSTLCPQCGNLVGIQDETCFRCGRKNPGRSNWFEKSFKAVMQIEFEKWVTGVCILLFLCTLVWDLEGIRSGGFNFLGPSSESLVLFGGSGAYPIFRMGRWWTPLSAALLHGGLLHIGFNLYWLNILLPPVRHVYGRARTIFGFTIASIVGFFLTSLMGAFLGPIPILGGAQLTIGASAPIFGMLGMLVASGGALGRTMKTYAIIFALFGLVFPGVDNWAHAGGFLGGYLTGQFFQRLPPKPRNENMVAMVCLLAFIAAVVVSVIVNLPFVRSL